MTAIDPSSPPNRRQCSLVSLAMMLLAIAVPAIVELLARDSAIVRALDRVERNFATKNNTIYHDAENFRDFEERLLLDELPKADRSAGGVYLFGTSNLKWATAPWAPPVELPNRFHNCGIGASSHAEQFRFVRYLVDHEDLLQAGGPENLFIFGASYHCVGMQAGEDVYFPNLWKRYPWFEYDSARGIEPRELPRWRQGAVTERLRVAGFLTRTFNDLRQSIVERLKRPWANRPSRHDSAAYQKLRRNFVGPEWEARIEAQVAELERMIAYSQDRGVRVEVILLPLGTWDDGLPYGAAYNGAAKAVCRRRDVPCLDWSRQMDDADFVDSSHLNTQGMAKFQRALLDHLGLHSPRLDGSK